MSFLFESNFKTTNHNEMLGVYFLQWFSRELILWSLFLINSKKNEVYIAGSRRVNPFIVCIVSLIEPTFMQL